MIDGEVGLLRQTEAAKRLAVSARTLEKWRVSGKGPRFVRLGRAVAYDPADLDEFIQAGRRRSTSDPGQRAAAPRRLTIKPEGLTPDQIGELAGRIALAEIAAESARRTGR